MNQLFRKKALDRLASPDQIDRLMVVTTPVGWLALTAVAILIGCATAWSFQGRIPTKVRGKGILLSKGGVKTIQAPGSGRIAEVLVKVGDRVRAGQTIARLSQPELEEQRRQAQQQLAQLLRYKELQETQDQQNLSLNRQESTQRRHQLEHEIVSAKEQLKYLDGKLKAERHAHRMGLITGDTVAQTVAQSEQEKGKIETARSSLQALAVKDQSLVVATSQAMERRAKEIAELQARLAGLTKQIELTTMVVSYCDGRAAEVHHGEGEFVQTGETVLSVEPHDAPLHALILVVEEGKKVRNGMIAEIAPVVARRELFGFMFGMISSVSSMPSSHSALLHILKNPDLIKQLTGGAAPFTMYAELASAPTASGFRWSSSAGPSTRIHAGTVCDVEIVVDQVRPIELLIPKIKETFGL